jgi:hypothetical protein
MYVYILKPGLFREVESSDVPFHLLCSSMLREQSGKYSWKAAVIWREEGIQDGQADSDS